MESSFGDLKLLVHCETILISNHLISLIKRTRLTTLQSSTPFSLSWNWLQWRIEQELTICLTVSNSSSSSHNLQKLAVPLFYRKVLGLIKLWPVNISLKDLCDIFSSRISQVPPCPVLVIWPWTSRCHFCWFSY